MRLLSTKDYFEFNCIGGECPLTCCAGWVIAVDRKTAEYYRSVDEEFGDELREGLTEKSGVTVFKLKRNHECVFLDDDKLCRIYKQLGGEQSLCNTCQKFPRVIYEVGDTLIYYLDNACPEVNRILMQKKTYIETLIEDSDIDDKSEIIKNETAMADTMLKILSVGIRLLQNRSIQINYRMILIALLLDALQDAANDEGRINEIIELFADEKVYTTFIKEFEAINTNYSECIKAFGIILGIVYSDPPESPLWKSCHELTGEIVKNGMNNETALRQAYSKLADESMSIEFEQLIIQRLFSVFEKGLNDGDYLGHFSREVVLIASLKSFIVLKRMGEPGECTLSDRSLFYSVCLRVEHSEIQKTELDEAIKEADFNTLDGIIRLCS